MKADARKLERQLDRLLELEPTNIIFPNCRPAAAQLH
jgi:hypothetical protein